MVEPTATGRTEDERFLRFVVQYLYDLIDADLTGEDGRGLDDALTTDDQITYLRTVFGEWERAYARSDNGSSPE